MCVIISDELHLLQQVLLHLSQELIITDQESSVHRTNCMQSQVQHKMSKPKCWTSRGCTIQSIAGRKHKEAIPSLQVQGDGA